MRSRQSLCLMVAAMLICWLTVGCDLSLGPKVATKYLIVHPGKPLQVLSQAKVKARLLDGSGDAVEQDIGGWICLPPDHWDAIKRALESTPTK